MTFDAARILPLLTTCAEHFRFSQRDHPRHREMATSHMNTSGRRERTFFQTWNVFQLLYFAKKGIRAMAW